MKFGVPCHELVLDFSWTRCFPELSTRPQLFLAAHQGGEVLQYNKCVGIALEASRPSNTTTTICRRRPA